ncbi:endonuclease/exonuclease/phosphatase family protein [Pedobacter xixiisoli]|uniref:Metal-dependent hydrolase, endonuclease/exonuclease/phosphatase family n=1 Tax=Pedobacter xixiisoli TaxID=1476464 RepID=A0A286A8S5_9SPHI|nr:endonuclease/exonuclease/phosphatase family protein [Pedobacter xixiisoli]SOD18310.1 Metal-dependent hydrolase, endonuclease/exonuclease/phosphatase family [Pedobacter xixiisoli]
MNRFFLTLVFSAFLAFAQAQQVRLATFNIRVDVAKDAPANMWRDRAAMVNSLISFHNFDVFGVQEAQPNQLADMERGLPNYTLVADAKHNGLNSSAIFFKTAVYDLVKSGSFWLAPNPKDDKKAWDAKYPRGCTWIGLKDKKTGKVFYYFNTHLDHVGIEARKHSVQIINTQIKEIAGENPAAICGDFNFNQHDENYKSIQQTAVLTDSFLLSPIKYTPNGTFNGFNITRSSEERIDHIFVTKQIKVERYGILTDCFSGKYPSDHFPVMIDVTFKK